MKTLLPIAAMVLALSVGAYAAMQQAAPGSVPVAPVDPAPPAPPEPPPCPGPNCPRRPWGPRFDAGQVSIGGATSPDGKVTLQADLLPFAKRIKNRGGSNGAGMCVMSSIEMAAEFAGLRQMRGLRDWCAQQPGGAYPSKVDRQVKEFCAAKGIPVPAYLQYEGSDVSVIERITASGRYACVTYNGHDGVRYSGPIAHMVCELACFRGGWVAILDNNAIQDNQVLWMTQADYVSRFSPGWVFVWLAPGAPPVPKR